MRVFLTLLLLPSAALPEATLVPDPSYLVHGTQAHPSLHFTQGLVYANGLLYESSGLYGKSLITVSDYASGRELQRLHLPAEIFAEGLTLHQGDLYLLTWKAGRALQLSADTLQVKAGFRYRGEGWGLTSDGRQLIMSDGSARLQFRNPADFQIERELTVTHGGKAVPLLNELEWIQGRIWANIWQQDRIVRIDPQTGLVDRTLDFAALRASLPMGHKADTMNGIAWLPSKGLLLLTGKYWPLLYEVEILPDTGSGRTRGSAPAHQASP